MTLKNNQSGYFTVEASLIVPIVLVCIFGTLAFLLYLYDLGTARSLLNQEAVQISDVIKTDGNIESGRFDQKKLMDRPLTYLLCINYPKKASEGTANLKKQLKGKLLVSQADQIILKAQQNQITGKIHLSYKIPVPIIGDWIGRAFQNELTIQIETGSNAEKMRRWDQLE